MELQGGGGRTKGGQRCRRERRPAAPAAALCSKRRGGCNRGAEVPPTAATGSASSGLVPQAGGGEQQEGRGATESSDRQRQQRPGEQQPQQDAYEERGGRRRGAGVRGGRSARERDLGDNVAGGGPPRTAAAHWGARVGQVRREHARRCSRGRSSKGARGHAAVSAANSAPERTVPPPQPLRRGRSGGWYREVRRGSAARSGGQGRQVAPKGGNTGKWRA